MVSRNWILNSTVKICNLNECYKNYTAIKIKFKILKTETCSMHRGR